MTEKIDFEKECEDVCYRFHVREGFDSDDRRQMLEDMVSLVASIAARVEEESLKRGFQHQGPFARLIHRYALPKVKP